jgi:hypothetical protein
MNGCVVHAVLAWLGFLRAGCALSGRARSVSVASVENLLWACGYRPLVLCRPVVQRAEKAMCRESPKHLLEALTGPHRVESMACRFNMEPFKNGARILAVKRVRLCTEIPSRGCARGQLGYPQ